MFLKSAQPLGNWVGLEAIFVVFRPGHFAFIQSVSWVLEKASVQRIEEAI